MPAAAFISGQQVQQQAFHRPVKLCAPACFSRVFMSARARGGQSLLTTFRV
ncbi:hypothetical protein AVDCRST_MAG84-4181 [uncultured Microcoleus sp.]|uniref:Uncharacterized protein n=1 Tax=uncultured Microcoleus sp. TaxID=259945 RepID=A0A6J4MWK4_9CYAN|nr:hypothetical protein AVDCRST_MAG84-4181 [uncultured Microcoleus sp.]